MKPVELKKDIYWVGAVDWDIRDFHGYSTDKGSTYNSYLIKDEKITLFDTVKAGFAGEMFHRIHGVCKPEDIDYLVVNHLELDHSGSLPQVVERIKPEKIFCSLMGRKSMLMHFPQAADWPLFPMKTGDEIKLGKHTVSFLETRMVHWPDSMFSYIPEAKLLISSDGFGHHWATSERFDDEVDVDEIMQHAAKYYANILMLYGPLIQKLVQTVKELNLDIEMIAPDHGVIWRKDPGRIIDAYDRWSRQVAKDKVVVVYDTMWHSTETMAKAIGETLTAAGLSVRVLNLGCNHRSDIMTEVLDAKAVVVGSATLNNQILPRVADFLTYMKGLKPVGKVGAAFGSYGWSGEAAKKITAELVEMKFKLADENGYRIQFVPTHETLQGCVELAEKVAEAVKAL